ncbi:MAG: COX15/CtaA family protein [Planctomycetaceae bacterium]|nr:COX15/CtaA family protein [Planctomycetaceae bacterium]
MPDHTIHPWLHRLAVSTICVAMITLIAGALVTSKNAGMAFRDWPTSDGHAMLTYPWLTDFARDRDKFLEHGHRLAGVLIGLWSIALAGAVLFCETRKWVKWAACGVLVGVICQGILGGFRVWFDERGLAQLHGAFAACVLSLMAVVSVALSSGWERARQLPPLPGFNAAPIWALLTTAVLALQYLLGGMIRHGGTALHEHLGLGVLALLVVVVNTVVATRSKVVWVRRSAYCLQSLVLLQVILGGGAWVTRFGFGPTGYVAVADSIGQITFRTAHTVLGILVLMTAVVHVARTQRIAWVGRLQGDASTHAAFSRQLPTAGGAA